MLRAPVHANNLICTEITPRKITKRKTAFRQWHWHSNDWSAGEWMRYNILSLYSGCCIHKNRPVHSQTNETRQSASFFLRMSFASKRMSVPHAIEHAWQFNFNYRILNRLITPVPGIAGLFTVFSSVVFTSSVVNFGRSDVADLK